MRFVIGDIHGEVTKLTQLLKRLSEYPIDNLIFVGDYMDKGEDSRATLLLLEKLATIYPCTFLQGDHEYAWSCFCARGEYKYFLLKYGGGTTMRDFDIAGLDRITVRQKLYQPHKLFFQQLKPYVFIDRFIISHAGINPALSNKPHWETLDEKEFLFHRFDFIQFHQLRENRIFVFGHTAFTFPYYDGLKIGIDTGAVYQRQNALTAFELDQRFFLNHRGNIVKLSDIDQSACPTLIKEE